MLRIFRVRYERLDYYLERTVAGAGRYVEPAGYFLDVRGEETPVTKPALAALVTGRGDDGRPKNVHQRRVRIVAFDATFAAPKSVSILFGLGEPHVAAALFDAHAASVREVLGFVDRRLVAVRSRSGGTDSVAHAATDAVAVFAHRTSRASEPHLHSHVLVPNVARTTAGWWAALDARPLYVHAGLLGALYRCALRRNVGERLSVRWRESRPGFFDVDGVPRALMPAFSSRRAAILADATGPAAPSRARAADMTRPPLDVDWTFEELRDRWWTTAHSLGVSRGRIAEATERRARPVPLLAATRSAHLAAMLSGLADELAEGAHIAELEQAAPRSSGLWPFGPWCPRGGRARTARVAPDRPRRAIAAEIEMSPQAGRAPIASRTR